MRRRRASHITLMNTRARTVWLRNSFSFSFKRSVFPSNWTDSGLRTPLTIPFQKVSSSERISPMFTYSAAFILPFAVRISLSPDVENREKWLLCTTASASGDHAQKTHMPTSFTDSYIYVCVYRVEACTWPGNIPRRLSNYSTCVHTCTHTLHLTHTTSHTHSLAVGL